MIIDSAKVDVGEEYLLRWLETRRTVNTRRAYSRAAENFQSFSRVPLSQATRQDIIAWAESMKKRQLRPATISARVLALSSFYRFMQELMPGGDVANPADIKRLLPKVSRFDQSRSLEPSEVRRLLGVIPSTGSVIGMRDYAMILGYILLGRRNEEWRLAAVRDFEVRDNGIFYCWEGKGSRGVLEVPEELWKVVQDYIQASGGRKMFDPVFLDQMGSHPISERRMGQILARYAALAGIKGRLRVHDLRHTAAMLRREAGADMEEIRDFLRHQSLATTQIYLHRMDRKADKRVRAVVELLGLTSDR